MYLIICVSYSHEYRYIHMSMSMILKVGAVPKYKTLTL